MNKFTRRILRQKKAQERKSYAMYNRVFRTQINTLIESYTGDINSLIDSVPLIINQTSSDIDNATIRTWGDCGRTFGYESREDTLSNSKRIRGLRVKYATIEQWEETFTQNATNYISQYVAEKTSQILSTQSNVVVRQLESILTQTIEEGLSIEETAELLSNDFKKWGYSMSEKRATLIARTEVNSASNWAQQNGADSIGMPLEKFWSTMGLQNIRPTHVSCQAQGWIDNDLRFVNGLLRPGDQSTGDVGEFANCRCTAQFRVKLLA